MINRVKIFFILLIIINIATSTKAQEIFLKAGVGFYSLYENNILPEREREISINPTLITSVGLTWQLGDLFYLGWENSVRFKSPRAEFIGLDTTNNTKATKYYADFRFINIDTKAIGKFRITEFIDGTIFLVAGTGLSIELSYNSEYTTINKNVVVNLSDEMPPETPELLNNSGILAEIGTEAKYKSFSLNVSFLMEFFNAYLYDVGDNKSILTQISIMYSF